MAPVPHDGRVLDVHDPLVGYVREGRTDRFYKSMDWQRKRAEIIARDNYECQRCKRMGRVGPGEMVHHVVHLKDEPTLGLCDSNLVTLCNRCHAEVHEQELSGNYARRSNVLSDERW